MGTITLIHDTHFHGRFKDAFDQAQNVATYFGIHEAIADRRENVLRLGNGDDLASSVLSVVFDGRHMVDALNAGGLDYDTFGNHDFDMEPEILRKRVADSEFTWVSANVRDEAASDVFAAEAGAARYVIEEVGGVAVGITGVITVEASEITSIGEDTRVLDPAETLAEVVPEMREEGADAVVVLSHVAGSEARSVAEAVDGIDAIVGDHAAEVLDEPEVVNDTLLSFVGDEFEYISELSLCVGEDGITDHEFTRHKTAALVEEGAIEPHPDVQAVREEYGAKLEAELDEVIGETEIALDTRRKTVRTRESNLGNFVADAMRDETGADLALMNGGGIRSDALYGPGEITNRTIVGILPFPNDVVILEVTGEILRVALENGVSQIEDLSGRFPQVSGFSYTFDPDAPVGERVREVCIRGEPVDPSATYTLATNDFIAGGGDGYEMLADATVLRYSNAGPLLSTLVIATIEAESPIAPEVEGRIVRLDRVRKCLANDRSDVRGRLTEIQLYGSEVDVRHRPPVRRPADRHRR
ncbi:bifunctional metallophosphatase/5'-nucleotidase [Natronococcus wangiae]|uniref:bifunctional metallophosphatase/5'-nucleotidase n=1 Tax=Natronococcus wangiae TaxID=3068275 RepID=UPI00273FA9FB|nr:5'-nucleotidase C-terminal domain-containing protein [Natronococcus sp. AD5]